jgi:putative DNA primase/helicase
MTIEKTVDRARGQWPEILRRLGVDARYLRKRHGPCPVCGGKDRFRFDDRHEGWHYCNQCGAGPGIVLLRKLRGWDYATACKAIDEILGGRDFRTKPRPSSPAEPPPSPWAQLYVEWQRTMP